MQIEAFIGQPKKLSEWARQCIEQPGKGFGLLYDDQFDSALTLETLMFPIISDSRDMSDDDHQAFEAAIDESHYCRFLNLDQLEDVVVNLTMQQQHFSGTELMNAIAFYMDHDAFIVLADG